jgi:hypothetical protein
VAGPSVSLEDAFAHCVSGPHKSRVDSSGLLHPAVILFIVGLLYRCPGHAMRRFLAAGIVPPLVGIDVLVPGVSATIILADAPEEARNNLIATGSELSLAAKAHEQLIAESIAARVLSMPSWDIFEREP